MAEAGTELEANLDVEVAELEPGDLPEEIKLHLRRARHCHKRARRARIGSNERENAIEVRDQHMQKAMLLAAEAKIDLQDLPDWASTVFNEEKIVPKEP